MQNIEQIILYLLTGFGIFLLLLLIIVIISAIVLAFKFRYTIKRTQEDPEYAETIKDKLARYHTNKFLNKQSGCCGDKKGDQE